MEQTHLEKPGRDEWAIASWRRAELIRGGMTSRYLQNLNTSGQLAKLRRGSYVSFDEWERLEPAQRHVIRARDVGGELIGKAAISHLSAAVVHGIPIPPVNLPRVHVTWPMSPGRRGTRNIHPHRGRVDDDDMVDVDGMVVTSAARTVFDIARSHDVRTAVAVADGALRMKLCSRTDFEDVRFRYRNTPGAHQIAKILDFADGRSDSIGESISRVQFAQVGLPTPELQVPLASPSGEVFARVDFEFTDFGTVGEFDGMQKYVRYLRPGQTSSDVVLAEKLREDRIRETGREVVRLVWADLNRNTAVLTRFKAAFARAGHPQWRPGLRRFVTLEVPHRGW